MRVPSMIALPPRTPVRASNIGYSALVFISLSIRQHRAKCQEKHRGLSIRVSLVLQSISTTRPRSRRIPNRPAPTVSRRCLCRCSPASKYRCFSPPSSALTEILIRSLPLKLRGGFLRSAGSSTLCSIARRKAAGRRSPVFGSLVDQELFGFLRHFHGQAVLDRRLVTFFSSISTMFSRFAARADGKHDHVVQSAA